MCACNATLLLTGFLIGFAVAAVPAAALLLGLVNERTFARDDQERPQ